MRNLPRRRLVATLKMKPIFRHLCMIAVLFLTAPAIASACSCMSSNSTCNTDWKSGEVIFLGTVTAKVPMETSNRVGDQVYLSNPRNAVHFSVTDNFRKGVGQEVVVYTGAGGGDCGYPFIVGTTYLVYAYTQENQLTTSICTQTSPEVRVSRVVRELRALREGHRTAVLFGTIGIGPRGVGYEDLVESKPLDGIRVRAVGSNAADYSTMTDQQGGYSFESLPPGTYQLELDLPTGLSTQQRIQGKAHTIRVGVQTSGCRADVFARPDGRISGVVTDGAGQPRPGFVTIRPADREEAEAASRRGGLPGYTTEDGKFSLPQIPPGRYELLFYPMVDGKVNLGSTPTLSEVIDLGFGQHLEDFDFKVPFVNNSP